uniref:Uncharacterized protein n=1 Tax=Tetradesmus obliquus TaxID=3088 RepID=A0A383WDQ4_TETOB
MEADEVLCAKVQLEELKAQWQRLQDGRIAFNMLLDDSSQSGVSDDDSEEIALSMQIASLEAYVGSLEGSCNSELQTAASLLDDAAASVLSSEEWELWGLNGALPDLGAGAKVTAPPAAAAAAGAGGIRQPSSQAVSTKLATAAAFDSCEHTGPIHKQVSFSEQHPEVILVPGSMEQRGTDLAATLAGHKPFCRALSWQGAALLLTAQLQQQDGAMQQQQGLGAGFGSSRTRRGSAGSATNAEQQQQQQQQQAEDVAGSSSACSQQLLLLGLKAAGEAGSAAGGRPLQLGQVQLPNLPDDVADTVRANLLQAWAQLVLDCMADLVAYKGSLHGLQAMLQGPLQLLHNSSSEAASAPMTGQYLEAAAEEGAWKLVMISRCLTRLLVRLLVQRQQQAAALAAALAAYDWEVRSAGSGAVAAAARAPAAAGGYWEYLVDDSSSSSSSSSSDAEELQQQGIEAVAAAATGAASCTRQQGHGGSSSSSSSSSDAEELQQQGIEAVAAAATGAASCTVPTSQQAAAAAAAAAAEAAAELEKEEAAAAAGEGAAAGNAAKAAYTAPDTAEDGSSSFNRGTTSEKLTRCQLLEQQQELEQQQQQKGKGGYVQKRVAQLMQLLPLGTGSSGYTTSKSAATAASAASAAEASGVQWGPSGPVMARGVRQPTAAAGRTGHGGFDEQQHGLSAPSESTFAVADSVLPCSSSSSSSSSNYYSNAASVEDAAAEVPPAVSGAVPARWSGEVLNGITDAAATSAAAAAAADPPAMPDSPGHSVQGSKQRGAVVCYAGAVDQQVIAEAAEAEKLKIILRTKHISQPRAYTSRRPANTVQITDTNALPDTDWAGAAAPPPAAAAATAAGITAAGYVVLHSDLEWPPRSAGSSSSTGGTAAAAAAAGTGAAALAGAAAAAGGTAAQWAPVSYKSQYAHASSNSSSSSVIGSALLDLLPVPKTRHQHEAQQDARLSRAASACSSLEVEERWGLSGAIAGPPARSNSSSSSSSDSFTSLSSACSGQQWEERWGLSGALPAPPARPDSPGTSFTRPSEYKRHHWWQQFNNVFNSSDLLAGSSPAAKCVSNDAGLCRVCSKPATTHCPWCESVKYW